MLIVFHAPNHTLTSGALQIRTWEIINFAFLNSLSLGIKLKQYNKASFSTPESTPIEMYILLILVTFKFTMLFLTVSNML